MPAQPWLSHAEEDAADFGNTGPKRRKRAA